VLSDPAVRILERIRETQRGRAKSRGNRSGWVFPGRRPDRPIESVRSVQNRIRANADVGDFRPQDIPRTVGMNLGAEGVPRLTIAKVLNHAEPELASGYDRSSRDPEKQEALDAWAGDS
jgi:integrase